MAGEFMATLSMRSTTMKSENATDSQPSSPPKKRTNDTHTSGPQDTDNGPDGNSPIMTPSPRRFFHPLPPKPPPSTYVEPAVKIGELTTTQTGQLLHHPAGSAYGNAPSGPQDGNFHSFAGYPQGLYSQNSHHQNSYSPRIYTQPSDLYNRNSNTGSFQQSYQTNHSYAGNYYSNEKWSQRCYPYDNGEDNGELCLDEPPGDFTLNSGPPGSYPAGGFPAGNCYYQSNSASSADGLFPANSVRGPWQPMSPSCEVHPSFYERYPGGLTPITRSSPNQDYHIDAQNHSGIPHSPPHSQKNAHRDQLSGSEPLHSGSYLREGAAVIQGTLEVPQNSSPVQSGRYKSNFGPTSTQAQPPSPPSDQGFHSFMPDPDFELSLNSLVPGLIIYIRKGNRRQRDDEGWRGHPAIVRSWTADGLVDLVKLTSKDITHYYHSRYKSMKEIRKNLAGYLLIDDGATAGHLGLPVLHLQGGERLAKRSYVNIAEPKSVPVWELAHLQINHRMVTRVVVPEDLGRLEEQIARATGAGRAMRQ